MKNIILLLITMISFSQENQEVNKDIIKNFVVDLLLTDKSSDKVLKKYSILSDDEIRDATGNIEDIVINESKQLSSRNAGFQMSRVQGTNGSSCNDCTQMSNQWIDDVLVRMSGNSNNPAGQQLAQEIRNFNRANPNGITRTISGVDRSTGELFIIKI